MNMKETQRILASITAIYPSFTRDRDCAVLARVWQQVFAGVPYPDVSRALAAFIASDTKGFPPTPGAVNAYIFKARQLCEPTEDEAWARVMKAVSRSCYYSAEEYAKLPEDIREIVGSPRMLHEWSQMSAGELNTVIGPGFKRSWRARRELRQELAPFLRPGESGPLKLE